MNLEKLVVVGGMSGIQKVAANRNNGLIIENFDTGKKRFVGARKYQFTPLGSVTIYSEDPDDVIQLSTVLETMLEKRTELPLPEISASKQDLHAYFAQIMPNYDADRVHASDMKKIIKWFNYMDQRNIFAMLEEEAKKAEEEAKKAEAEAEAKKVEEAAAKAEVAETETVTTTTVAGDAPETTPS